MNGRSQVHVVDDDAQVRQAVAALVEAMGMTAHGYASAEDFLCKYDGARPACLVTDVRMLGMSGLELQEELRRRGIGISVVIISAFASTPSAVRAMRNGAVTVLEKPCRDDELWEAIRDALAADREDAASELAAAASQRRWESLTPKEREVLSLISAGDSNKVVASKLKVSVRTIELHRRNVFVKMGADSLAELVRMVVPLEISQRR